MKKGMVVGLSITALIGFCIVLFYQVTHIEEPAARKSMVSKRTNIVDFLVETISDEKIPLSSGIEDTDDGYTVNNSNKDASKKIKSSKITSFFCNFSTLYDEDTMTLGKKQWKLRADFDGKTVKGSYAAFDSDSEDERRFEADEKFMGDLLDIILQYDIASYNGIDTETQGISDEYGATLGVMFESGENIYASNNEENFIPIEAEEAFVQLFASACAKGSDVIGISVNEQYADLGDSGAAGYISFPLLHLGRTDAFGKIDELKYPTEEELHRAIDGINSYEKDEALSAKEEIEKNYGIAHKENPDEYGTDLYYDSECFVTRNDSEVVSLYVRENSKTNADEDSGYTSYRSYNIDSVTGENLQFSETFRDLKKLPALIEKEIRTKYPGHKFYENLSERINDSIIENDGDVCFCLGNGFVHLFINEGVLSSENGGYHITLPFADNPKLVSNFYLEYPVKTFTKLDYNTDYYLRDGHSFRMSCEINEDDVLWRAVAEGKTCEMPFYGHAPEVYLTETAEGSYLFLNVPAGDVSFHGILYEITDRGVKVAEENGDLGLSVVPETTLDPEFILMHVNEVIDGPVCFMYPTGVYRIDTDGFPVPATKEFRLTGEKVVVRESGRYNPKDTEDAANSGGMYYVAEGTELTPYASDLSNYIDFITVGEKQSRIIRFTIDEFSSNMKLDNFGGLGKVFNRDIR
ncbi:hypothetical protein [Butyrivibrio sp. JL13D10]|uniref:hypothetical protein n=1 Tax=Butyrivibrio sp. JL13D10 TaxID=3236815 RepID=UPI0038B49703